jgi:hypothetical protein
MLLVCTAKLAASGQQNFLSGVQAAKGTLSSKLPAVIAKRYCRWYRSFLFVPLILPSPAMLLVARLPPPPPPLPLLLLLLLLLLAGHEL